MKKSRLLALCVCVYGLILSPAMWASPVTITSNSMVSDFLEGALPIANDTFTGTTIPSSATLTAGTGSNSSMTNINYSGDASYALFAYDFSHAIDNTVGDTSTNNIARSLNNALYFTATSAATYSIDGYYGMTGQLGTGTFFDVRLYDITTSSYVFRDLSQSTNMANEYFTLGDSGDGDYSNLTTGSLSGNLVAGHDYVFIFNASISSFDYISVTQVTATAAGAVNLNIGAVPVPAAVWLFGSGLIGLLGITRKKKAA